MCGPMVTCGYCGNNCCNGGTRSSYLNDQCPDNCTSAYEMQSKEIDERWEKFHKSEKYVKWEQEREDILKRGDIL